MPLILMKRFTKLALRENRDWLFVFGDNFERVGFGGQARICRGEPNAIGIPTKHGPYSVAEAYLTDSDLDHWERETASAWTVIFDWLEDGGTVVWPEDGIGTGYAQLAERAPKIMAAINLRLGKMKERR